MKIGILIDRMNVGGVEKVALEEVAALQALNHDATLIVLRRKGVVNDAFPELRKNIPIVYLDDRLPRLLRLSASFPIFHFFSLFHLTYPWLIPWVIRSKEFDYLISHGTYTTFTAITIKKIRHIPYSTYIWDPIGYILQRVYKDRLPRLAFILLLAIARRLDITVIKNANTVLVGGSAHNKYIKTLVPSVRICAIPPSVHIPPKSQGKKQDYLLMVTAWKRGKHPEYIVDLIAKLPQINIKLVGRWIEEDYRKEFEELLKKHHVDKKVDIVGGVSEQELTKYYREALVFLQINDDRGFGMPALEAAANGTAFIIPRGQGVCALFKDGVDGFYTKERDTKIITSHLSNLLEDRTMAIEMGRHASELVRQNYSWRRHGEQLEEMIGKYV